MKKTQTQQCKPVLKQSVLPVLPALRKSSTKFSNVLRRCKAEGHKGLAKELENKSARSMEVQREEHQFRRKELASHKEEEANSVYEQIEENREENSRNQMEVIGNLTSHPTLLDSRSFQIQALLQRVKELATKAQHTKFSDGSKEYSIPLQDLGWANGRFVATQSKDGKLNLRLLGLGKEINTLLNQNKSTLLARLRARNLSVRDVAFG